MRAPAVLFVMALTVHAGLRAQSATPILAADQGTHLHPIASFTGSAWVPVPATGLGRLAPRDWTRWYTQGSSVSIRLSVREPTGRCAAPRRLPIATPPTPPAGQFDRTYIGIAASSTLHVDPMTRITEGSPVWTRIAAAVGPLFERRASDHGIASSTLARVPMTVDWVYGTDRGSGPATYYFEASKRVPDAGNTPEEDPKGVVRVAISGWLRAVADQVVPAGTKGELHWEPADERLFTRQASLTPLGVIRHGDERIWVMKGQKGARDTFALYALGTSAVRPLFTIDAGVC